MIYFLRRKNSNTVLGIDNQDNAHIPFPRKSLERLDDHICVASLCNAVEEGKAIGGPIRGRTSPNESHIQNPSVLRRLLCHGAPAQTRLKIDSCIRLTEFRNFEVEIFMHDAKGRIGGFVVIPKPVADLSRQSLLSAYLRGSSDVF